MAAILGFETGISLPSFNMSGVGTWITIFAIVILLVVLVGLAIWWYLDRRLFNRKIVIFENIAGQGYQPTKYDRAKILKVGDGGEEVLFLKKHKCYRTAYGRKMGPNTYWFAIGQDGYWYNFLLGDLDAKMNMLDIEPIDRDMRYMHVAIRKNITERYRKVGIMEKYGTMIIGGIFLLIMGALAWILISKVGGLIQISKDTVAAAQPIADALTNAVSHLDTVCSSSGISAA